jgi:hypothetical protein
MRTPWSCLKLLRLAAATNMPFVIVSALVLRAAQPAS